MQEKELSSKKKLKKVIFYGITICLCITGLVAGYYIWLKSTQIIPSEIKKQLTINVVWPAKSSPIKPDKSSFKYNSEEKLLSYVAALEDGNKITISEQPTPESFIDIPNAYEKLITSMQKYKAFENSGGKVYLTRPETLKGAQTAVANRQGILLFARPDKDLSDDTWVKIFNNFEPLNN